jgi:RHS repeat-associated protein
LIETPEGKIAYTYNEFGLQTSVKTDNDTPVNYTYDNFGRLKTVEHDNQTTTYEYDAFGNLIKTTTNKVSERLVTTYKYDIMNRLIKLTNFVDANQNGILDSGDDRNSQFDYDLDDLGRKEKATEVFGNDNSQTNVIDWTYDNAGRLIRESFNHYDDVLDQAQEWEYDLVGNRTKQKLDIGIDDIWEAFTTYDYDVNDRLINEIVDDLTIANKDKITMYGYDNTQQTSKKISENGQLVSETTFEYDAQGRMSVVTIITENRKEVTKYEYGADGIRVSAEHEVWEDGELKSKTRTEYLNDPLSITGYSQVLKQTETNIVTGEKTVTTYVIGHQRISQIVTDNYSNQQEYRFTFDGHGSTRVLLGLASAMTQLYSFDAYGNAIGFNPSEALTEFLYSGEQFDSKIGQQYLRARYYDPVTGRFNRLDPFFGNKSDPQSFHKYLYTNADPVNGIDPSGEFGMGLGGFGAFMAYSVNLAAVSAIATTATSMIVSATVAYNVGNHFATKGMLPDGYIVNGGLGIATKGLQAGGSVSFYIERSTGNTHVLFSVEGGTAPLSALKNFGGAKPSLAKSITAGLVWNSDSVQDLTGTSINVTVPIIANRTQFNLPITFDNFRTLMLTIAQYSKGKNIVNLRTGSIVLSQSLSSSAVITSGGTKDYNFGSTVSYSWNPVNLGNSGDWINSAINLVSSYFASVKHLENTPLYEQHLATAFDNVANYIENLP